jgi:tripartite-type tricarboxylate transporter receptor subunit TctC
MGRKETGDPVRAFSQKKIEMASACLPLAIALLGAMTAASSAWAQTYPDRPVRMVIAFPAGGTIDTLGRILGQQLGEGQNVVIENRPGGGGNIGAAAAAKSAPDGYTLHLGAQTLAVNATVQPSKDFDPIADFDPITLVGTAQDVLLVPVTSPFRSVSDLIQYARQHPGELNYGSLGTGTSAHLATVLFSELAGIRLQQVPYRSVSQTTTDIISGRLALFLPTLGGHVGKRDRRAVASPRGFGKRACGPTTRCADLQRARNKIRR